MAKMWAGRFKKEIDERVNDFNSSIRFDQRMYKHDIFGSIAHAMMLGEQGIIPVTEAQKIVAGLEDILEALESGALAIDPSAEDIHMFIEATLTEKLGESGKRLHTARSRNDQVALDLRFYLKDETTELIQLTKSLIHVFCDLAAKHTETVMTGYTHLQRAQPVTFAHHLMAYVQMFLRDISRLEETQNRMDEMPLGSGALAGTTYDIHRQRVAELLGFADITQNSLDGVSDRDFAIELTSDLAILMMHLSRFCEEIILWCSWEFKFIELDDAYATGSSIMPQKKNPDIAELIRGKTGRVIGDLVTLLTMMKGLPLAYNKDMQEDKEAVFDAVDTAKLCLTTLAPMVETMTVLKENMRQAAAKGFINATDCADYLVKKGMAFRDAYQITGKLVALCIEKNTTLEALDLASYQALSDLFSEDIYQAIDLVTCVNERKVAGGPAKSAVEQQIKVALEKI
ncbi:argininosuccinate lyase [Enterococcus alcedinis]|uniref:Argininosuccinate lyase n=1 Tax=Enterococcus alcedinis TaxID=1274384 RepID=A0A917JIZ0_9ENTE|nr:argininosuccinate lyase [Enterococcus alcedinis]MBP2103021.1 argininosuccinate lyase [Enterococcus alcedinis]GGI66506.1 argininosuccinate lyase [Enterococcus alcedinis]